MNDLFNAVDSNRDGIIDFNEFVQFYDMHKFNTSTTDRVSHLKLIYSSFSTLTGEFNKFYSVHLKKIAITFNSLV